MGFLDSVRRLFSPTFNSNIIEIHLKCHKCKNEIKVLLRKSYEISRVYEDKNNIRHKVNKVVICDKCFNRINFNLGFDKYYQIISRQIEGGSFINKKEDNK